MSDTKLPVTKKAHNGSNRSTGPIDNAQILEELCWAIDMGAGDFALLLVRCNYQTLRQQLIESLQTSTELDIATITLKPQETSLYSAIAAQGETNPAALSVLGLNEIVAVEDILAAANNMREAFRQNFPFPLLLWVDDELINLIHQRMPDFKSWGSTTFRFDLETEALLAQLEDFFNRYLEAVSQRSAFTPVAEFFTPQTIRETELAVAELTRRQVSLSPNLAGGLEFYRGSVALGATSRPTPETCAKALAHYQVSLGHWQETQNLLGLSLANFYSSLCHAHREDWLLAKTARQESIEAFTKAERPDLVACFVGSLGPVLVKLDHWEELEQSLAQWQTLHSDLPAELSQDWSLRADVAKHKQDWSQMQSDAEQAIALWAEQISPQSVPLNYCLQRCEALAQQGQVSVVIEILEEARQTYQPESDPTAFVQLLNQLRQLYFQEKQYQKAFEIKQERRSIQYQFQMRAFLGAGQLRPSKESTSESHTSFVASGRQEDIDTLVNVRVQEPRYKATVLCGPSGVGKSSLVRAGLVPALTGKPLRDRQVLPVVLRVYSNWAVGLGDALHNALEAYPDVRIQGAIASVEQLIAQLKHNAQQHLLTVLIFDQFEEFFFTCHQPAQRRKFYAFLKDCLKGTTIQFVKVIFSLREDYLHELLEFEDFVEDLELDFLSREQRQRVENFSPEIARSVISELSQRSALRLDNALIDAMVQSLTNEFGRIRPVELQVVGAQLEAEGIGTLEAYGQLGDDPKQVLAERWVGAVVKDCGPENEDAAWQVLFALTNENDTRPLLTMTELSTALEDYQQLLGTEAGSLEADILPILVGAGLVVRWPQEPEDHYQLVHDYLVGPIRQRYNAGYQYQIEQLVKDKQQAEEKQRETEKRRKKLQWWTVLGALGSAIVFAGLAIFAGRSAIRETRLAARSDRAEKLETARRLAAQAERLLLQKSNLRPTAALLAIESYKRFTEQNYSPVEADISLRQASNRLPELTKTIEHEDLVWGTAFSDDSQYFVTASTDGTAKLIEVASGTEVMTIEHDDEIWSFSFSDNSQYLATGSIDGTVKLIEVASGTEVMTIEHDDAISTGVSFSDDSQYLATGSKDGTVKLIEVTTGTEVMTIEHHDEISRVFFSKNGQYLATGSDNTVKLTDVATGQEVITVEHDDEVGWVTISEDGQYLATRSDDGTAKLLKIATRKEVTTIEHKDSIEGVGFSDDSQYLATHSRDGTTKLIEVATGQEVTTVNHKDEVLDFVFSDDSQYLATRSRDGTVKLIRVATGQEISTIEHNDEVSSFAFSKNSQYLATGSRDNTAKLIEIATGQEISTILHNSTIRGIAFSENSKYLATGSDDGTAKLIEITTGQEVATIEHETRIRDVEFSKNSRYLATGSDDGTAKLIKLDFPNSQEEQTVIAHNSISRYKSSEDNQYIAIGSRDGTAKLIETATGQEVASIKHKDEVRGFAFSKDNQYIATGSRDGTAKLIEISTGQEVTSIEHKDMVWQVLFSEDSHYLVTRSKDGTAKLIETATGQEVASIEHKDEVWNFAFSKDHQYLATGSRDGIVKLIETSTGQEVVSIKHESGIRSIDFSKDNRYLATGSNDGTAKLIEISTGQEVASIEHEDIVWTVIFSNDNQYLATVSDDGIVKVIELDSKEETIASKHEDEVWSVAFSDDSQYLATGSKDGTVKLFEIATSQQSTPIQHKDEIWQIVFSSNSQYLGARSKDNTATLLELATNRVTLIKHEDVVWDIEFSEDNQHLVTASRDKTAKLTDVATGQETAVIDHSGGVYYASFSKDSKRLITANIGSQIRSTRISTPEERVSKICDRIQRNLSVDEWKLYINDSLKNYRLTCPNSSIHPSVFKEIGNLIKEKDVLGQQEARSILENLQKIKPDIDLYPESEAIDLNIDAVIKSWQLAHIVENGVEAAQARKLDDAIEHFSNAKAQSSNIDLNPETPDLDLDPAITARAIAFESNLDRIEDTINNLPSLSVGRTLRLLEDLKNLQDINSTEDIPGNLWYKICWSGSTVDRANEVLSACEAAVTHNPNHGGYRDSRGLARALTGNTTGAIEDFQAYIDWSGSPPRRKKQRQKWIDALKAGEDPFTEELLKELRG